jgi:hypothetical protein
MSSKESANKEFIEQKKANHLTSLYHRKKLFNKKFNNNNKNNLGEKEQKSHDDSSNKPFSYAPDASTQQLLQNRLLDIEARISQHHSAISSVNSALQQTQVDAAEVINYLEAEIRRRDVTVRKLSEDIRIENETFESNYHNAINDYSNSLQNNNQDYEQRELTLLANNRALLSELSDLKLFKQMKSELMSEYKSSLLMLKGNETRHSQQLEAIKQQFLRAKNNFLTKANNSLDKNKKQFKHELSKELDINSEQTLANNDSIQASLLFHIKIANEKQLENKELKIELKELQGKLSSIQQDSKNCAALAVSYNKQMNELAIKISTLNQSINTVNSEINSLKLTESNLLVSTQQPIERNKKHIQSIILTKHTQSSIIQQNLNTLQSQHNSIEAAFIHALKQVKQQIYRRNLAKYEVTKTRYIEAVEKGIKSLEAPKQPSRIIHLKHLTSNDKEQVLRLLFAGLNSSEEEMIESRPSSALSSKNSTRPQSNYSVESPNESNTKDQTFLTNYAFGEA